MNWIAFLSAAATAAGPGFGETADPPARPAAAGTFVAAPPAGSRAGQPPAETDVSLPLLQDDGLTVDGVLDEAAWAEAAVLTDFSQYLPVDGLPAADRTEVLVWYSERALHLGIRAFEPHGDVVATLADRDRIFGDDHVQVLLDPFHDGRRANVFAVNPLGVQADGTRTEEQRSRQWFSAEEGTDVVDLSPDYVFESKGRVTPEGYEVEIRIPFKSLRYPSEQPQTWGINVIRQVQHSGHVQTWTPVRRGEASFLAQGGTLTGLQGMRRGLVLDITPEVTNQVVGASDPAGGWSYDRQGADVGANVRLGLTTDLTLNGTVNPDFSQVEADAAQIQFDPRRALSYPEKRPFFLEGAEQFDAPGRLVYTRRIVDPEAAVKLAGQFGGVDVGFLSAVDDPAFSRGGSSHPVYNILRVRRPVGEQSTVGFTWTDRVEGGDYNRVGAVDGRLVSGAYTLSGLLAGSRTVVEGAGATAPMWSLSLNRAGREFGWSVSTSGSDPDFVAGSGFQARPGVGYVSAGPRFTRFGEEGARVESWSTSVTMNHMWLFDRFARGRPDEAKLHFNNTLTLRGGWTVGGSFLLENFLYPEALYEGIAIDLGTDTVPFVGRESINNYDVVLSFGTPQFQTFSAGGFVVLGRDENFAEWAPGWISWTNARATWRPTPQLRVEGTYDETRVLRTSDRSRVSIVQVPRLKMEYQLTRPLFVRLVGQYFSSRRDALRDDGRTDGPLLRWDPTTSRYAAIGARASNDFAFDALLSYRPNPGTVIFLGYGGSVVDEGAFRFRGLRRTGDQLFVKLSWLFRM